MINLLINFDYERDEQRRTADLDNLWLTMSN